MSLEAMIEEVVQRAVKQALREEWRALSQAPASERLYSLLDLAKASGVSTRSLKRLVREGSLEPIGEGRLARFRLPALEEALRRHALRTDGPRALAREFLARAHRVRTAAR